MNGGRMPSSPRDPFVSCRDKFSNLSASINPRLVCAVDFRWHSQLINWISSGGPKPPRPSLERLGINGKLHPFMEYKKDYEIIEEDTWPLITRTFGEMSPIRACFVKHPSTGKPQIITNYTKFHVKLPSSMSTITYADPSWSVAEFKNLLCNIHHEDTSHTRLLIDQNLKIIDLNQTLSNLQSQINAFDCLFLASDGSSAQAQSIHSILITPQLKIPSGLPTRRNVLPLKTTGSESKQQLPLFHASNPMTSTLNLSSQKKPILSGGAHSLDSTFPSTETLPPLGAADVYSMSNYPRPVGLKNLGNTCFFNAAIQCLCRVSKLTDLIVSPQFEGQLNKNNPKGSRGHIALAFRDFILDMASSSCSTRNPSKLRNAIIEKYSRFADYGQHDSQELLCSLLDGLHEDCNQSWYAKGREQKKELTSNDDSWTVHIAKNISPIVSLFHGELYSSIECPACNNCVSVHDPFVFLSLSIPSDKQDNVTLDECLNSFSHCDTLDENNTWKCEKCGGNVRATKRMGIFRCSDILLIHLKRFSGCGVHSTKIETPVIYPDVLDMSKYTRSPKGDKYQLIGSVFHSGDLTGGHYTAVCLDQVAKKWYYFNDGSSSPIDVSGAHSRKAYILFYQKYI